MPLDPPTIAIIIVGYKSLPTLPECLESIKKSSVAPHSVYFLDNNSNDGSIEYINTHYSEVITVQSEKNLGFAEGNNLLIRRALEDGVDACFLLNPDTVLETQCIEELQKNYDSKTIIQPLILLHKEGAPTDIVNTLGNPLHYLGFSYAGGNNLPKPSGKGEEIPLASGAAVLFPADILKKIGLFDATFFMYHEDADLSWRSRLAGYSIRSLYGAVVWHKYVFSKNPQKFYFADRNRIIFLLKNYQIRTLVLLLPFALLTELFLMLYAAMGGWFFKKIQGYGNILSLLPTIMKSRKAIQSTRTLSDRTLYRLMTPRLSFSEVDSLPVKLYNLLSQGYWYIIKRI